MVMTLFYLWRTKSLKARNASRTKPAWHRNFSNRKFQRQGNFAFDMAQLTAVASDVISCVALINVGQDIAV